MPRCSCHMNVLYFLMVYSYLPKLTNFLSAPVLMASFHAMMRRLKQQKRNYNKMLQSNHLISRHTDTGTLASGSRKTGACHFGRHRFNQHGLFLCGITVFHLPAPLAGLGLSSHRIVLTPAGFILGLSWQSAGL